MYDEIEYETPFEGTPDKPITYRDPLTKIIDTGTEATNFADEIGPIPKTLEGGMRSLELDQEQKQKVIDEKKQIDAFNVETGVEEQRVEAERRLAIDAQEAREDM